MEAEIKRLAPRAIPGFRPSKPERVDTQTLIYPFDEAFARFAVTYLRTPSRVLWDVASLAAERLEPLYAELKALIEEERPRWLFQGARISVAVPDATDLPASGLQVRGTIKNAIIDGAKKHGIDVELDPENPDIPFLVRGKKRPIVLSIDLAGRSMHERGWRLEEGAAPLKETLAAQILMLSRWDPRTEALVDPMSGSGTIPIEAALMAIAAPLWVKRIALDRIPPFSRKLDAPKPLFEDAHPTIIGNEIHTPLVEIARRNAERAGASNRVHFMHGDFRDLTKTRLAREAKDVDLSRGLLVVNPPYGARITEGKGRRSAEPDAPDDPELTLLYRGLRDLHRSLGRGWRAAFIVANEELERVIAGRPSLKKPMWNGPIRAWLLVYD